MGTKPREYIEPLAPGHTLESVPMPPSFSPSTEPQPEEPMAYVRNPVTSAHAIEVTSDPPRVSVRDSAAIGPNGTIVHGRYGELSRESTKGIPLEYLALLRPAAEGAAAVRTVTEGDSGTLLVYGGSRDGGMSAVQLAASSGCAVVSVVDGQHSGNEEMSDIVKHMSPEPGTAVPEEFALVKCNFRHLVRCTSEGDDPSKWTNYDPDTFLSDFKQNAIDYAAAFPETLPAAVDPAVLDFQGQEKDRENFRINMDTYLSQFQPSATPTDPAKLDANFDLTQYAAFKAKFHVQTTALITHNDEPQFFEPSRAVMEMSNLPEPLNERIAQQKAADGFDFVPYEFSILDQKFGPGVEPKVGGPILGAVIVSTPDLKVAAEAVEAAPTLRAKAEALQFLTDGQRNSFSAACAVAAIAKEAGRKVVVIGGTLPGLETVEPTDADIQEALSAMAILDDGKSRLNYFLQVYRAGDFPVYADYAVFRATEVLAGPRQIVVTK